MCVCVCSVPEALLQRVCITALFSIDLEQMDGGESVGSVL